SVSISHTTNFGGWIAVPRPAQIGWDVELAERIKMPIIQRVCSKEEIAEAPRPEFLWCAKESFYKALEDQQPPTIIDLSIAEWTSLAPDMWSFKGYGPRNGAGVFI